MCRQEGRGLLEDNVGLGPVWAVGDEFVRERPGKKREGGEGRQRERREGGRDGGSGRERKQCDDNVYMYIVHVCNHWMCLSKVSVSSKCSCLVVTPIRLPSSHKRERV